MEVALVERDCTPRCKSRQQAAQIFAAIIRGDFQQIRTYCWWLCRHFTHLSDPMGRNALHIAASCGKWQVVQWLLESCGAEVDVRDWESGWTALHRAIFYGQLHAARMLLQRGASLRCTDHAGMTPLDLLTKDRLPHVEYLPTDPSEVYTWGANASFNLGQGNDLSRTSPELLDSLRRDNVSIKQVVMCKFHSSFLSNDGKLMTCGHGHGGRLGQNSEQTSLTPALVKGLGGGKCLQVASGQDHLLLLIEGGQVYSCGLNTYHQLGHPAPPPERLLLPRPLSLKPLKGIDCVQGVAAAKYHSVIYTKDALFTFGLNAGQLGHPHGERTQVLPRQVSSLNQKDLLIKLVAASDGATVCATSKGDVYVLHQYQCRRIASRQLDLKKVCVVGGHLDSRSNVSGLREGGGNELKVLLLTESGKLLLWRENCPVLRRCLNSQGPQPVVSDTCLSHFGLGIVTQEGGALWGHFRQSAAPLAIASPAHREEATRSIPIGGNWAAMQPSQAASPPALNPSSPLANSHSKPLRQLVSFLDRDECEVIKVKRIPSAHRVTSIACDPKGRNMALIQSHPKACLLSLPVLSHYPLDKDLGRLHREACAQDDLHDVQIRVSSGRIFYCHRFVLASRSEHLRKLLSNQQCPREELLLESIDPGVMDSLLEFIYGNTCDLLRQGKPLPPSASKTEATKKGSKAGVNKKSRHPVQDTSYKKSQQHSPEQEAMVSQLREGCKRLGLKLLSEMLQDVIVIDGRLKSNRDPTLPRMEFDRTSFVEYYDVVLESEEGVEFQCHKCILVARLEYFEHMLQAPIWMEGSSRAPIHLPMPARVLGLLLDYLYMNRVDKLYESEDVDFLCQCLAMSDQLLIPRLKEMCEVALVDLVSLKNACELLELSHLYNASQLRESCHQYIFINLAAILEAGSLDVLSEEVMEMMTRSYRQLVQGMCRRILTPCHSQPPSSEELESLCHFFPAPDPGQDLTVGVEHGSKSAGRSSNKRRNHQRRISERSDDEQMILLPPVSEPTTPPPPSKLCSSPEPVSRMSPSPSKPVPIARILKPWPQSHVSGSQSSTDGDFDIGQVMQKQVERVKEVARHQQVLAGPIKKLSQRERKAISLAGCTPIHELENIKSPTSKALGPASPPNAWGKKSSTTAAPCSPLTEVPEVPQLEDIFKEESLRTAPVQAKPLHLIHIEDKAMEELSVLYSAMGHPEEHIRIVRVNSVSPSLPSASHQSFSKWSKRLH